MEQTVEIAGQTVSIHYSGNTPGSYDPIVYLHSLKGNGYEVWEQCQLLHCSSFTLVSILTPSWNDSLTPWKCEGLFAEDAPFKETLSSILCSLKRLLPKPNCSSGQLHSIVALQAIRWQGVSAMRSFNTALFDGLASASGSLWYPGFSKYISANTFAKKPLCLFLPRLKRSKNTQPPSSQRFARNK